MLIDNDNSDNDGDDEDDDDDDNDDDSPRCGRIGVVHAYVGQKVLKRYIILIFSNFTVSQN